MATVGVGTKSRDKKGFFVSSKEKGRREVLFQGNDLKCIKGNGPDYISSLFKPRINIALQCDEQRTQSHSTIL